MSKWCPKCEWNGNDPYAKFCKLCGTKLIGQEHRDCPTCKTPYLFPSLVSHCSNCGKNLIVSPIKSKSGKRKTMNNKKLFSYDEANEILKTKLNLTTEQWQQVHSDLLYLNPSEYNFDETVDDLAFNFLHVAPEQYLPFVCGKLLGAFTHKSMMNLIKRRKKQKFFFSPKVAQEKTT